MGDACRKQRKRLALREIVGPFLGGDTLGMFGELTRDISHDGKGEMFVHA